MLRIIGGDWKGRGLKSPKGHEARPTLGRVREAVFSIIEEDIAGARVLDLFAGAGALGFESLSRGAESCVFVDRRHASVALIAQSARALDCADRVKALKAELPGALAKESVAKAAMANGAFDVVLMDPPYERGLVSGVLEALVERGWLAPEAVVVVETRRGETFAIPEGLQPTKSKTYGDTEVRFFVNCVSGESW